MRPDLRGSVKLYERHVFVATGTWDWPGHLDQSPDLYGRIAADCAARADVFPVGTKVTAIDDPPRGLGVDLLVFPDLVRYPGVDEDAWREILESHLVKGSPPGGLPAEPITGRHLFVCVHGRRDERCGRCGPSVAERLVEEVSSRPGEWHVHRTSHVGGHQYAANVLVFPPGDWYGYVMPEDASRLLEAARSGGVLEDLWRGRMGQGART